MRPALIPPLLALAWGLNWPAVKIALSVVPPFSLRGLGLGSGALLLLLLALVQRRRLWPEAAAWPGIALSGGLTVALFSFFTAFAQLNTSTSRAAVLTFTMPMMAAALAWWLLGERPGRRAGVALALGSAGIGVLAWPVLRGLGSDTGAAPAGLVLPLLAAFAWAAGTVASKRWPPIGDRVVHTAWQLVIGAACGAVAAALSGERLPVLWPAPVLAALAFHIVIATAVAYVLWYRMLASQSVTVSSLTTLAVPVVGVLGAMLLVGERPGGADWLGFALVLGSAALVVLPGASRTDQSSGR